MNNWTLIENDLQLLEFARVENSSFPVEAKSFPCFARACEKDGGIVGAYIDIEFAYPPENLASLSSFKAGLTAAN